VVANCLAAQKVALGDAVLTRRQNVWPAYVDLFGGLLITTLGGLILLTGHYREQKQIADDISRVHAKVDTLAQRLNEAIQKSSTLHSYVTDCKDGSGDVCVTLAIRFPTDKDVISNDVRVALGKFGGILKRALDEQFDDAQRKAVQIVIEGHADATENHKLPTARERFLHNWNLSSKRATSVLWELERAGLEPHKYNIAAIGYGASRAKHLPTADKELLELDRHTMVRLHVDGRALGTPD
jgi:flagellar motor protein MotB